MVKKGETLSATNPLSGGFDASYDGTPPWDIGRAQREIIKLAQSGILRSDILDVGCGTGENALYLASLGFNVWGVDAAPKAIAKAQKKSEEKKIATHFESADALHLKELNKKFDTLIDCGLFHVFSDEDRSLYVKSLHEALKPGGRYFLLCFSDKEPGTWGPRRIKKSELEAAFAKGWKIETIREAVFETNFDEPIVQAWLAMIERTE